ncbi:MAG: purK [Candidatus Kaiserbacteria bacterium]|nr:purK [Candidatus Kaiserbacteria bacterium]
MSNTQVIKPGSTLGILGDGQLGRMLAMAAAQLGYKVAVLGPGGRESPTGHVSYWAKAWGPNVEVSEELLDEFCALVSVVMIEWENIPIALVERIKNKGIPVRPDSSVLAVAQDRMLEKAAAQSVGIKTPHYKHLEWGLGILTAKSLALEDGILKTCRDGYDGKGQVRVKAGEKLEKAWAQLKNVPCVLEELVDFACEISIIVARAPGQVPKTYGPFQNEHVNGILKNATKYAKGTSLLGYFWKEKSEQIVQNAIKATTSLAAHLDVHGLLAVEFFVLHDGTVLFNEMAPRPHNSGHLTMECCYTSQFEQYVRAVCNLPFGSSEFHSWGTMHNLLGDEEGELQSLYHSERTSFHLYGKKGEKTGRKTGHVVYYRIDT